MPDIRWVNKVDNSGFIKGMDEVKSAIKSAVSDMERLAGISLSIYGAKAFVEQVANMRAYFQDIESSMKVFLGNAERGAEFTKQLKDYAYYNMFEFKELAQASQQMIAYGHSVESIIPRLDQLSNVATGTHAPLMELVSAYNKAKSTGVVDGRDIQSWAVKGVMIKDVLKEMGETAVGTTITFEQLNKVLDHVTGEGGMFHNLMGEMMNNISAEIGQFQDNLDSKLNEIGERYQDVIVSGIKLGSEVVDALDEIDGGIIDAGFTAAGKAIEYLRENFKELAAIIRDGVAAYGAYRAALIATNVAEGVSVAWKNKSIISTGALTATQISDTLAVNANTASKGANTVATRILTAAQAALNSTLLASPWTWAAMAIGAVAFAIYKNVTAISAEEAAEKDLANTMDELDEKYKTYNEETEAAIALAKDESKASSERKKGMDILISRYPDIIQKYIDEKGQLQDIANLKREIAELDGLAKHNETIETIQKNIGDYERYDKIADLMQRGQYAKISKDDRDFYQGFTKEMRDKGVKTWDAESRNEFIANAKKDADNQIKALESQRKLDEFAKEGGALGEMTTAQLESLKNELVRFNTEAAENDKQARVLISWVDENLDYTQRNNLLTTVNGMLKARNRERVGAEKTFKEVSDDYFKQSSQLKTIENRVKSGLKTFVKETSEGIWEMVAEGTEGAVLMETKEYEDIQKRAKAAETAFKNMGGDTRSSSKTKKRRVAEIQEAWKRQEELKEIEKKASDERADAEIAAIRNAGRREEAERNEQHKRTLRNLEEQQEEIYKTIYNQRKTAWERSHKDSPYELTSQGSQGWGSGAMSGTLSDEEQKYFDERMKVVNASLDKENTSYSLYLEEKRRKDMEYMDEYLSKYGDFMAQKEAITRIYDRKIDDSSGNPYEVAALEQEREKAISSARMNELRSSFDWEGIFNNLSSYSVDFLNEIRNNLAEALKDPSLDIENRKLISEKIHDIDDRILYETEGLFNFVGARTMQHKRLVEEATEAQARYDEAFKEETQARNEYNASVAAIKSLFGERGMVLGDVSAKDTDNLLETFGALGGDTDVLRKALDGLAKSEVKLSEKTKKTKDARQDATAAEDKAKEDLDERIARRLADMADWANKYLGDLPGLLNKVGLGGLGDKAQLGLDAVNSAAGAAADFMSGNYVGAASKAFDALSNVGDILGVGGSSDKTLHDDIERLTNSNEALEDAVANLATVMSEASVMEATSLYDKQVDFIRQTEKNTQEMMQRSAAAYSSGFWGSGIGGKSSSANKINKGINASEWQQISSIVGRSVKDATDFFNLSSQQMWNVRQNLPVIYARIKQLADDGYEDAAVFMDKYTEFWKELEDSEQNYFDKMTSVSFDSIQSDFASTLMDMESDAKDMTENFEEYLKQAIMQAMLLDNYKPWMEKWYRMFAQYMEGGLEEAERKALKEGGWMKNENGVLEWVEGWDTQMANALNDRNALAETWGWKKDSFSQEASARAWGSMSQDQAESLNGRFTALQIAGENINSNVAIILGNIRAMQELTSSSGTTLTEIRNLHIIGNGFLEDIAKYTKPLLGVGEKLDKLIENTK